MATNDYTQAFQNWLSSLSKHPVPVLLNSASLPVRYFLLRDILDTQDEEMFSAIRNNLRRFEPRRKCLAQQQMDGHWPLKDAAKHLNQDQINTLQFLRQTEILHQLLDMAGTLKSEKISLGLTRLMKFMDGDGNFPGRPYHQMHALYIAVRYGLEGNPLVRKAIMGWFRRQNPDGGWPAEEDDSSSCIWTTMLFLMTFAQSPAARKRRGTERAVEFILNNALSESSSSILPGIQPWDSLAYGYSGLSILNGGTLRFLEIMSHLDRPADRSIRKYLLWLENQQLPNGLWPAIVGRDKHGSEQVTLRALYVFKHFTPKLVAGMNRK